MHPRQKIILEPLHLTFSGELQDRPASINGVSLLSALRKGRVRITSTQYCGLFARRRMKRFIRLSLENACFGDITGASVAWAIQHGRPIDSVPWTHGDIYDLADDLFAKIRFPLLPLTDEMMQWLCLALLFSGAVVFYAGLFAAVAVLAWSFPLLVSAVNVAAVIAGCLTLSGGVVLIRLLGRKGRRS